ncbi:cytochrome c [Paracoccus suum]|uniref:Cytochrome c n=1 Tax=Paracoccus suum TaxID=2259340 RepID=A0A344PMC5_9RHOB|nr:cytochrome c [Paracoccus suum]AXC50530.1 cytochrome c [Paracoccus suum]
MKHNIALAVFAAVLGASTIGASAADFAQTSTAQTLPQTGGKEIYNAVCSACHMPGGQGATGAGAYPALAGNEFVDSADSVIAWVLNGHKAMPPLGGVMDDAQVADVVNYVRHDLGNSFEGDTTAEDVAAVR